MVSAGMLRDDAYRIVQDCAATAIGSGTDFRAVLAADDRVTLGAGELDAAFDPARVLRNAGLGIEALDSVSL